MTFITKFHWYYCGIDLHTGKMYVYVTKKKGGALVNKNIDAELVIKV